MPDLNYELAPRPGQTVSQRKAELDGSRFVAVRNLAYMVYKKPDGQPLLSYPETLANHEIVKGAIIQHEMALNLLVDDRGAVAAPPQPQPAQPVAQMTGASPMPQQPAPVHQFAPPPATAAQAAQVPQQPPYAPPQATPQYQAPPPQMAPQQMQMPLQQQPPPQASPAAAAAAGEPAPTGRKRRGAGAAVAPPPAAPPPTGPVQPVYGAPPATQAVAPGFAAAPQYAPPQQPQQPQYAPPAPPAPQVAPQYQPMSQQTGGQPALTVDLGPVLQKLDLLGKGLEIAAGNSDQALKMVAALSAELTETRLVAMQALSCLHHLYGAQFAQALQGVDTLDKFRTFLARYVGQLPAIAHPK